LAFSPDGRTLAVVHGPPPSIYSPDPKPRPAPDVIRFWPDVIQLWDVSTGRERRRLTSSTGQLDKPVFSADGRKLIARNNKGVLFCWDVTCGELSFCLPGRQWPSVPYALVPDGRSLVWCEGNVLREIRLEDGHVLRRWEIDDRDLSELFFSRDGKTLITHGEGVRFWDFADGKERHAFEAHRVPVDQTIFSHDGRSLVPRDSSGVVRRWEVQSGKPLPLGDGRPDRAADILPLDGGKSFLSIGEDLTARVRDLCTGKVVREFVPGTPATIRKWRHLLNQSEIRISRDEVSRPAPSPDGRTL